jgi:hypothetical protein
MAPGIRCSRVYTVIPATLLRDLDEYIITTRWSEASKDQGVRNSCLEVFCLHHGLRTLDPHIRTSLKIKVSLISARSTVIPPLFSLITRKMSIVLNYPVQISLLWIGFSPRIQYHQQTCTPFTLAWVIKKVNLGLVGMAPEQEYPAILGSSWKLLQFTNLLISIA